MKRKKIFISILIVLILIYCVASVISFLKFNVWNPIYSFSSVARIMLTDIVFVEIQKNPRVVLSKSDDAWKIFLLTLEAKGYKYLKNEQMGSLCVFEKEGVKEKIHFSVNSIYSIWRWEN